MSRLISDSETQSIGSLAQSEQRTRNRSEAAYTDSPIAWSAMTGLSRHPFHLLGGQKILSDDFSSDESGIDDDDPGESSSGEAAKDRPWKGMKMSAENFAAAEIAVDELWKTCGQSGHMVLTHDRLQNLCEAVQKIANDMCRRA